MKKFSKIMDLKICKHKGWLRLFPVSGFFLRKRKTECSRVASNLHLSMRASAFESSDDEETFLYLFYDHKTYK